MSFNLVSSLLCVSSDTETVHIFKLAANGNSPGAVHNHVSYEKELQEKEVNGRGSSVG